MTGFRSPNYTITPNELYDILLKVAGYAELKITMAVIRGTLGFHRRSFACSVPEMMTRTGLSYPAVLGGREACNHRGYVSGRNIGNQTTIWTVHINFEMDELSTTPQVTLGVDDEVPLKQLEGTPQVTLGVPSSNLRGTPQVTLPHLNKYLNKALKENLKHNNTTTDVHPDFSDDQIYFLKALDKTEFANTRQAEAVSELAEKYPDTFRLAVDWAAENGMTPGQAIQRMRKALPKWIVGTKQKQPKDDSEESRRRYVSGPYADVIEH